MRDPFVHIASGTFAPANGMESHPFFPDRHRRLLDALLMRGIVAPENCRLVQPCRLEDLAHVLTPALVCQLACDDGIRHALCAPDAQGDLQARFLTPALAAVAATRMTVLAAVDFGFSVHLGGGFHHASRRRAEGFCLLPDITLAIDAVRAEKPGLPVMVVDLDAHHGNGVAADFCDDPSVFVLDMFNADIYPRGPRQKMKTGIQVPLSSFCDDGLYLSALAGALDAAFARFSPGLVIFNAGADVLAGDPLGRLGLTAEGLALRDAMVVQAAQAHGAAVCMLMAGGYSEGAVPAVTASLVGLARNPGVFGPRRAASKPEVKPFRD